MIVFWIGTTAELIKTFPVIIETKKKKIEFIVIATGQNDILKTDVLKLCTNGVVDLLLSDSNRIKKTPMGLFIWFIKTYKNAIPKIKKITNGNNTDVMIVHGDTVSTLMGAMIAKKCNMKIAHIEAGLRSFDLLHPFPEEIDRILTSRYVDYHFSPGEIATKNLLKVKGTVFNTVFNTIWDSLQHSIDYQSNNLMVKNIKNNKPYFVFVIHRQENVMNQKFLINVIDSIVQISKNMNCIFILHEITKNALINFDLFETIKIPSIITTDRMEYLDFMSVLADSEFVITDGGSNQEELAYMGKPCLILRKKTERFDGIGQNAMLMTDNLECINSFAENYKQYIHKPQKVLQSPSEFIVTTIASLIQ